MPLPDLIEIVPFNGPVSAEIAVPGSKSITNRALILAALAEGPSTLRGALWSEDTQVMVTALRDLGFEVKVETDPCEFCNRTITVEGLGGRIPHAGTPGRPLEAFVGNAGTAARFLAALVCLGPGAYRLHGVPRMHERPQAGLFQALRELGYDVESEKGDDRLPAQILGTAPSSGVEPDFDPATGRFTGTWARNCSVSIASSSQFASALLLCARTGGWNVTIVGENAEESPYVTMTSELIRAFPKYRHAFQIEPDASSGSYFLAAARFVPPRSDPGQPRDTLRPFSSKRSRSVTVAHWPTSGWQADQKFDAVLRATLDLPLALALRDLRGGTMSTPEIQQVLRSMPVPVTISRRRDLGDSIMMAIVYAAAGPVPVRFSDLGPLRLQECERVAALRTELTKCGAKVVEEGDTLTVSPAQLHSAEIETYNDHRMAMCFAILGLKSPGIRIMNPACVKKTFPNFFQKLAGPPPTGLGVTIRDGHSGRALGGAELFAE